MGAGGRPTKYDDGILKKVDEYLKRHKSYGDIIPSVAGLACVLDVTKKTLYNWADKNKEFLHALERIAQKQEKLCLSGGLSGDFNSTITKLLLGNHGYHEKQDLDHTTKGEKIERIERVIVE